MSRRKINVEDVCRLVDLKKQGHSIHEMKKITGHGYGTICRYTKETQILPEYYNQWAIKRGGSKRIAENKWETAREHANSFIKALSKTDKLLILACLYWGEGTKKGDFCIMNSDPELIRVFVDCLDSLGVHKSRLKVSVRIYEDVHKINAIKFWAKTVGISPMSIVSVNVLNGKKRGKLPHGMCRLRIAKGEEYLKLVMSLIEVIKNRCSRRSTDRTWVS